MTDWNDLATTWQTEQRAVDVEGLAAAARAGHRRQVARFAVEVLASIAVVAFWVPSMVGGGTGVRLLGGGSIVFVIVWCALLWRTLRGTWSSSSATAAAYGALEVERLRAARRWTTAVRGFVVAAVVLFVVALPFLVRDGAALYSREPWRLVIGVVGFVLVCAGLWVATARHRRRLDAALASVAVPDGID